MRAGDHQDGDRHRGSRCCRTRSHRGIAVGRPPPGKLRRIQRYGEALRAEGSRVVHDGGALRHRFRGVGRAEAEHLIPQPRRDHGQRRQAEQHYRPHLVALALAADLAAFDMAADALAHQHGHLAVPAAQHVVERQARLPPRSRH
jgi:hypothetical protein